MILLAQGIGKEKEVQRIVRGGTDTQIVLTINVFPVWTLLSELGALSSLYC